MKDQQFLFKLFTDWYDEAVSAALKEGAFDDGVYDLQGELVLGPQVVYIDPFNKEQRTKRYVIAVDRGIKWEDAQLAYEDAQAQFAKENAGYLSLAGLILLVFILNPLNTHQAEGKKRLQWILCAQQVQKHYTGYEES